MFAPRSFCQCLPSRCVHPNMPDPVIVGSSKSTCSLHFLHISLRFFSSSDVLKLSKKVFFAVHKWALSPNFLPVRCFRVVALAVMLLQWMFVQLSFKWYHRVFYFYPMILDLENVVDVSKQLDSLSLAVSINLERTPFSLVCKLILRRSLRQRNQGTASNTLAAVMCDAGDPCSVNTAYEPESSFTTSLRKIGQHLYLWNCFSKSEFFKSQ